MKNSLFKMGFVLLFITVLSKAAAFCVTIVFSYYFGSGEVTDAYYAAGTIPNLVNNSLTICALTLFVPVYTKCYVEEGEDKASEFVSVILNAFVIFNLGLFLVICALSAPLSLVVAPGFTADKLNHTRQLICLLSMSFPVTVAACIYGNLYNANHKYILPAGLTLFNHVFTIICCILLAQRYGLYVYPFITTIAWTMQLFTLHLGARNKLFQYSFCINTNNEYFRYMLMKSVPVMITTAADQINLAADSIISSSLHDGSISRLGYAHRVFNSLNGVVTSTLLTIYYPIISKQYIEKDKKIMKNVKRYLEIMLMFTLPVTFMFIGNSTDIINIVFNRGAMEDRDITDITLLLNIYMCGLLFMSIKEFATRLFYITGDTTTPTIINIVCVVVNISLSVVLKGLLGLYGIALATMISTVICAFIECITILRNMGGIHLIRKYRVIHEKTFVQIICSSLLSFFLMYIVRFLVNSDVHYLLLFTSVLTYVISYVLIMLLCGNEYMTNTIKGILGKVKVI